MDGVQFKDLIGQVMESSHNKLMVKNQEYNTGEDPLRNFRVAATLQNTNAKRALTGVMSKHIVSIFDMAEAPTAYVEEIWDEKITDAINYLLMLRVLVWEDCHSQKEAIVEDF